MKPLIHTPHNDSPESLPAELERLEQLYIDRFTEGATGRELRPIRSAILAIQSKLATLPSGNTTKP